MTSTAASLADKSGINFHYSIRDIAIVLALGLVAGFANTATGNVWFLANERLGPLGGALLQGGFMWAYILVMWLVRKPGCALALGIIETALEIALGNSAGMTTLGWGITQGISVEFIVAWSGYRFDILTALCAGAAASQFGTVWTAIAFGWAPASAADIWKAVPINLVSGAILSGLLGFMLANGLGAIGASIKEGEDLSVVP